MFKCCFNHHKAGVNSNPTAEMNTEVSIVVDKSSCLVTSLLSSNGMPSNQNKGVSTIESCLNVVSIISKAGAKRNATVGMNIKVSTVGDKSSCWLQCFCQAM